MKYRKVITLPILGILFLSMLTMGFDIRQYTITDLGTLGYGEWEKSTMIDLGTLGEGVFPRPPDKSKLSMETAEGNEAAMTIFLPLVFGANVPDMKPVIVGLRLSTGDFQPEGSLAGPAAVEQQRGDIADIREALLASLAGYNVEVYASWDSLPYVGLKVDAEALKQLAVSPYVTNIEEDSPERPHLASVTTHIGADDTWDAGFGGLGQTVVILDTGIDADHPFFGSRVVTEACWSNGPGQAGDVSLCDDGTNNQTGPGSANAETAQCWSTPGNTGTANICSHGSHVAGIAAGQDPGGANATGYSGVAPEASIIAIQVFTRHDNAADCAPDPAPCVGSYPSDQLNALNYINNTLRTSWNIASVNMSLGAGMFTSDCDGDNQGRKDAIDDLLSNDIATVISSGNDNYTDALGRPGCISTAITIGAVEDPNDDVIFNMHALVDLLAVGANVNSSVPDDAYSGNWWGTSMAAPQVTGAIAMIRAIDPSMSVADILNLLQTTGVLVTDTRPPNPPGAVSGHVKPRIQLDAAVAELTEADLRVFKDCKPDDPMFVGDTATCTIVVQHLGPDPAMAVTAVDEYVSDGTFDFGFVTTTAGTCATTGNPQTGAGTVTCELGGMQPGDTVTIQVPVMADEPQNINDLVTVSSTTPDPDYANNVAEDEINVVEVADLALTKTATPNPVVIAGTQLTYDLEVTNNGPSTAVNVVIEDVLPVGVTIDSVSSSAGTCNAGVPGNGTLPTTCTFDSLAPTASATMQIVVTVEPQTLGILGNNAEVSNDVYDPDNSNNLATTATIVESSADLAVSKSDSPDPVLAGEMLTYDVTIESNGPSAAVDVALIDTLPDEVGFVDYTISNGSGTCTLQTGPPDMVVCDLNDLNPGEFVTVFVDVLVDPAVPHGTTITNTATSSSVTPDPDSSNNTDTEDTLVQAETDLTITKDANVLTDNPAPRIVYTLVVMNTGPSNALEVVIVDELPLTPKKIVYIMDSGNGACTYDEGAHNVTCNFGTLATGESVSVDIIVDAKGSVGRITNVATVSSSTTDPDLSNNTAVKEVLIKGGPGPG